MPPGARLACRKRRISVTGALELARPKVLIAPFPRTVAEIFNPSDLERLGRFADIVWGRDEELPADALDRALPDLWSFVGCRLPFSAERLARAPALKAILEVGGSFPATIDYAACFARGIRVLSCAPAFAPQVAELALAMTGAAGRGLVAAHELFRAGDEVWQGDRPTDFTLFGQQVGFVGFGSLARSLLPLLAPFGCRVQVFDPWLPPSVIERAGCAPVSLETLLESSRVVYVLAVPTPENRGLLGAREFARMPQGALLVLVSRSHLVDFEALTDALFAERIQAAIDVFPVEPLPLDARIRKAPNVILSAHRGASIRKERQRIGAMAVDDLELMSKGLPPALMQPAQPELIVRRLGG